MKNIVAVLLLSLTLLGSALAYGTSFSDGWRDGYIEGYCYRQYACITPLVPIAPIPEIGERTYMDGYKRGFLDGLHARR